MAKKRPTTIPEYINAAPPAGKSHLNELYAILKEVAPKAGQAIKWGQPFFIEPRFLFAFAAHKTHVGFISTNDALDPYRENLKDYEITKMGILKIPYNKPIPKAAIKKIAKAQLKRVKGRQDENFW
jgi:uncharacterized protein YdhG (YjbR/CyaY superfamily)